MVNKRLGVLVAFIIICSVFSLVFVSASLDIKKQAVSIMAIKELNKPALFNLQLTNTGDSDTFTIYNLVGLDMEPKESFDLAAGETTSMALKVYPNLEPDYYSFEYKIKGEKSGIQKDELAIIISEIKDAFNIYFDDISPESTKTIVHIDNKGGYGFDSVKASITSSFFSLNQQFSIEPYENKQFEVQLNRESMKTLLAGAYVINTKIDIEDKSGTASSVLNFNELPNIKTTSSNEGIFLRRQEIDKQNTGNTKSEASISVTKNLLASLFTKVSPAPIRKEYSKFHVNYFFYSELAPNQSLKVVVKTNWWILLGIIVAVFILYYAIDKYIRNKIVLKKTVSFVRTKGGEFALRVALKVKARDYVEKIRVIDRLPPMTKLFEQYGLTKPDKMDDRLKRLEWNISGMSAGEERIFNYIIYSKIGVVGKFELPEAGAIYEYLGKIKEANSNVAFFMNEPKNKKE